MLVLCVLSLAACGTAPQSSSNAELAEGGSPAHSVDTTNAGSASADWCAARQVLERKCQRCHTDPPEHGAPFALLSYEDTQVVSAKGKPRYEQMAEAIRSDYMPAQFLKLDPEVEPLSEPERMTLLTWCDLGAPAPSAANPGCLDD